MIEEIQITIENKFYVEAKKTEIYLISNELLFFFTFLPVVLHHLRRLKRFFFFHNILIIKTQLKNLYRNLRTLIKVQFRRVPLSYFTNI